MRLFRMDLTKNTRSGLHLKAENAPIVRIYRIGEAKYFEDQAKKIDYLSQNHDTQIYNYEPSQ